jgi:hypothetical protein
MLKDKAKNKKRTKRIVPLALAAVLVFVMLGGFYVYRNRDNNEVAQTPNEPQETINFNPPTEEDKKAVDENKDRLTEKQDQQNNPPAGGSVTPVIISASYSGDSVEVRAFVPGIVETGGKCTVTLTKDGDKVARTGDAVQNASTTDCVPIVIARNEFGSSGTWKVSVSYASAKSNGSSNQNSEVNVP